MAAPAISIFSESSLSYRGGRTDVRTIARNLISLLLTQAASKGIGFLALAYVARQLSPAGFGILSFSGSFVAFFALFANFGLDTWGAIEIPRNPSGIGECAKTIFSIRVPLAAGTYMIYVFVVYRIPLPEVTKGTLQIFGVTLLATPFITDFLYNSLNRMHVVGMRDAIASLTLLLGFLFFVRKSTDLYDAAWAYVFSALLSVGLILVHYARQKFPTQLAFHGLAMRRALMDSWPIVLSTLMITIYYRVDTIFLQFMRNSREVGLYNAAYRVIFLLALAQALVNQSALPTFSRLWKENQAKLRSLVQLVMLGMLLTSFLVTVPIFLFGESIVRLIFGQAYEAGGAVLRTLIFTMMFVYNETVTAPLMYAINKQKFHLIIVSFGAATNLLLNLLLIPRLGMYGAAYATVATEAFIFSGLYWGASRFMDVPKKLFLESTVTLIALSLVSTSWSSLTGFVIFAVIAVGYFALRPLRIALKQYNFQSAEAI